MTVTDPDGSGGLREIRSEQLARQEMVPHGVLEPGRLQELTSRIAAGRYNRPDILDRVAGRLPIGLHHLRRPRGLLPRTTTWRRP